MNQLIRDKIHNAITTIIKPCRKKRDSDIENLFAVFVWFCENGSVNFGMDNNIYLDIKK